ncbi:MAG: glycogen synthase, partial [Nitrospirae bacterium]|nr:glycogen synthase [Nitrospirota bacterium]
MKVVLIASECVPYCKTGGLADVTRALFDELYAQGIDVHLMLPYYKGISARDISSTEVNFDISVGEGVYNVRVFKSGRVYFIYNKELFYRDGIYGYNGDYQDNDLRFAFFCKAALLALKRLSLNPDVLHLHDWQTAPVSVFLKNSFQNDKYYRKIRTVLTIHNLGYQGIFDRRALYLLDLDDSMFTPEYLEFYGKVNFLKGGILFSDVITTVSRKYAEEILSEEYGFGLHGVLRKRKKALYGIINGIDYSVWSPENDPFLYSSYSEENLKGKGLCKLALLKELGFSPGRNIPVFAFIGRLTTQKGLDLIEGALDMLVDKKCRVVILGE